MQSRRGGFAIAIVMLLSMPHGTVTGATIVPDAVKMPGSQPEDAVVPIESATVCAQCHGNYDPAVEPLHNWQGSMMAHAGRDPIFWATLAIAEQDFDGSGDLCIRCHSPTGWLGGRSAPTDGSGLDALSDRDGIECDVCHRLTNPDASEHAGAQFEPFLASSGNPAEGHYGSGQYVVTDSNATKLGPFADARPPTGAHGALASQFHRSSELCGTCHDVSNPVTGDLAHNNGAQIALGTGGGLGSDLADKVAFNYRPYEYGVVERTYSEHKAGTLSTTLVADYPTLPADLQAGALADAYAAATAATPDGNYADGAPRYFTCQTCHMPPVTGRGAGQPLNGPFAVPTRTDVPKHDLTGGNYWMPQAMQWLDARGRLKFGGLTAAEIAAMDAGAARARNNLEAAAGLSVVGDTVKVVNLTGHKLISGYPEGRRMWLNVRWYGADGTLLREDGAYGDLQTTLDLDGDGAPDTVRTLLDPYDANGRVYEVHGAITQEWASTLIAVDPAKYAPLVVAYDRVTGQPKATLADVAAQPAGSYHESFHFVLNNHVSFDTRIPPYGYSHDEAQRRNALPVPALQYGDPGPGGVYDYWDERPLAPPPGAATASVRLLYQPTSWEYVQFLFLANAAQNPTLADTGRDYLDAWLHTGMAEPHLMATATWTAGTIAEPPTGPETLLVDSLASWRLDAADTPLQPATTFNQGERVGILARVVDAAGTALAGATVTVEVRDAAGQLAATLTATSDAAGNALGIWQTEAPQGRGRRATPGTPTGTYEAQLVSAQQDGFTLDLANSATTTSFVIQ